MQEFDCETLISDFRYEADVRKPPNTAHRARFRAGWRDFTRRRKDYAEDTLNRLTWQNLGYRVGELLGEQTDDEIYAVFDKFARHYAEKESIHVESYYYVKKKQDPTQFAICIDNKGYEDALIAGKLYPVVTDNEAMDQDHLTVEDESGEAHGFPPACFHLVELPLPVENKLLSALKK